MVSYLLTFLKQRSIQTLLVLFLYVLCADHLPLSAHQSFYTLSMFIKDILLWMLPITVCFFIASTVQSFEKRAPLLILVLILFEGLSNFSSVWYAYGTAQITSTFLPPFEAQALATDFSTLWRLPFVKPKWWSAEKGAFVGLLLGCLTAFCPLTALRQGIIRAKGVAQWILTKIFARFIPLFVLGFAAYMYQTNLLQHVFTHYTILSGILVGVVGLYLLLLFALSAGFSWSRLGQHIRNLLPAGGVALTSSCSLSTMVWTIEGASKNLDSPPLAQAIIPATTNIQQIGDCIANSFLCFALYTHFFGHTPDLSVWLKFSLVFVLARYATAAVLGGAIFVMIPIYESYLNFTPEMVAIILAMNVVLDPLITSANVMANGALCRVFERVWQRIPSFWSSPIRLKPSDLK
jgi:Na+/H+-dicarboxylate symporter